MIGRLTETSLRAGELALTYEQLAWPQDPEEYGRLSAEAERLFGELEIEGAELPESHEAFLAVRSEITPKITSRLAEERSHILGDTVALPLFYLQSFSMRAALNLGLHVADTGERELIEDFLEDLGLDRDLSAGLEREAGWITLFEGESEEETTVRRSDVIKASAAFYLDVLEEFGKKEESQGGIGAVFSQLQELQASLDEFRAEQREANERVEQLIKEGNKEITDLVGQLNAALVAQGVDPAEAKQLTEGDPKGLWDRVIRWLGGAGPRDAAEAAFWVALDFVPGGVGVKLGIRIAEAVRKSIKSK